MLNVPPTWEPEGQRRGGVPLFASARPGVLWPCPQVASEFVAAADGGGGGSGGGGGGRSWTVDERDLWGRSLPRQGYSSGGSGGGGGASQLMSGGFVSQDNTAATAARLRGGGNEAPGGGGGGGAAAAFESAAFRISPGTFLTDECAGGDVEAVMGGRAAVAALQTWPGGHPFSLRDELMVWALEAGASGNGGGDAGLPLWLAGE
jgi:hypothetical protein